MKIYVRDYTKRSADGFTLVELNHSPNKIMWNWDRLNPEIKVKETKH